jgi:D-galactonate transporter
MGFKDMTDAHKSEQASPTLDSTYKKVSLHLLPFLFLCMIASYLDRVNVGFAKLQMQDDLAFSATVYGLGAGIFFVAYVLFEVPSNLLLTKIGTRKTLVRIMLAWGLTSAATALVHNPVSFYVVRFLLGAFEAGFAPAVLLYLTYWYSPKRRAQAFSTFLSAVALSGVIGGPVSGLIMERMQDVAGLQGWQWLFIIEGAPAIVLGVVAYFVLNERPDQAKWLTASEKALIAADLKAHTEGGGHQHSFAAALRQPKVYLLGFIYFSLLTGVYLISFWLPTMISQLSHFGELQVGIITCLPYLAAGIATIWLGHHSDKTGERRWHISISAGCGIIALILTTYISEPIISIALFTVATAGTFAAFPVFWSIPPRFFGGTAAAGSIALINSMGTFSGFVSPYIAGIVKDLTGSLQWVIFAIGALIAVGLCLMFIVVPKGVAAVEMPRSIKLYPRHGNS